MKTLINHLITVFGLIQPEMFLKSIRDTKLNATGFRNCTPGQSIYRHYALEHFKTLTYEEVDNLYRDMCCTISNREKMCGNSGVFSLLPEYTLRVLTMDMDHPICRQDHRLNWRECYLQLSQDLLTTAHLAYLSIAENRKNNFFGWSPVIGTDDRRLSEIINNGLAENHFHLKGSTRGFDLSWLCLMNHPGHIKKFFADKGSINIKNSINENFEENLSAGISLGTSDNRMTWQNRLIIACCLRAHLFLWLQSGKPPVDKTWQELLTKVDGINYFSTSTLANTIDSVKFLYGQGGKVMQSDGKLKYIDYAITADVALNNRNCRSLVGERAFMYNAFCTIYSGKSLCDDWHGFSDLFYLYILIKTQFRREMIQVNGRYGFKNFAKYQDRKDIIFEDFKEYNLEAKNLSINDTAKNCHVNSIEMRICPQKESSEQYNKIKTIDNEIMFLQNTKQPVSIKDKKLHGLDKEYFYVLHFPKFPDSYRPKWNGALSFLNKPRNYNVRATSERQAKAVAQAMTEHNWLCSRIRGFDACTFEIPCRPEVFATEFRFLRSFVCPDLNTRKLYGDIALQPKLSATYHVGEDFLDIIDGLRAIDEALLYLELKPGERLGHAIALGTDVSEYYKLKNRSIILQKQDYLDNIVWALNKSKQLNINIESAFKQKLYDKANSLIYEIYKINIPIADYYNSWLLRGDHPSLYQYGYFDEDEYKSKCIYRANSVFSQYSRYRIAKHHHLEALAPIRKNSTVASLYYKYHFDADVRAKGEECEEINITDSYIQMAKTLQIGMQREVSQLRIGVECNPSSNVLIGPFDSYAQHPIFTFYPPLNMTGEVTQFVSINTDDQGVFDTSLEEEFSLIECTLREIRENSEGNNYSDDQIYDYLERLRKNGFLQIFPKAKW